MPNHAQKINFTPKFILINFIPAIIEEIFEINSSFHEKQNTTGKVQFLFQGSFFLALEKKLFVRQTEPWAITL